MRPLVCLPEPPVVVVEAVPEAVGFVDGGGGDHVGGTAVATCAVVPDFETHGFWLRGVCWLVVSGVLGAELVDGRC